MEKNPTTSHIARVESLNLIADRYYHLILRPLKNFVHVPGQHVQLGFVDDNGAFARLFSIASAPRPTGDLEFFIQPIEERLKIALQTMSVGDLTSVVGPMGRFFILDEGRPLVLIAGGTGIAPFRAFLESLTEGFTNEPRQKITLIYGSRNQDCCLGAQDFINFNARGYKNITIYLTVEDGAKKPFRKGRVTEHLKDFVGASSKYYLCGPPAMMTAVKDQLTALGVEAADIFMEAHG